MDEFEELAGRIDGIAQAVLRLTAALEIAGLIDGPQLSEWWRTARPEHLATDTIRQAARRTLLEMTQALDDARQARSHLQ
jgi:hypothetical protein